MYYLSSYTNCTSYTSCTIVLVVHLNYTILLVILAILVVQLTRETELPTRWITVADKSERSFIKADVSKIRPQIHLLIRQDPPQMDPAATKPRLQKRKFSSEP